MSETNLSSKEKEYLNVRESIGYNSSVSYLVGWMKERNQPRTESYLPLGYVFKNRRSDLKKEKPQGKYKFK